MCKIENYGILKLKIIGILIENYGNFCIFAALIQKYKDMYYPRLVEKEIERAIKTSGAVLVTGPKFCGKTTTARGFAS